jgi:hypothetical protein
MRLEKIANGELHYTSFTKHYHNVHIKENEPGREFSMHWSCEKFWSENLKGICPITYLLTELSPS